jgi:hypothetical protein
MWQSSMIVPIAPRTDGTDGWPGPLLRAPLIQQFGLLPLDLVQQHRLQHLILDGFNPAVGRAGDESRD